MNAGQAGQASPQIRKFFPSAQVSPQALADFFDHLATLLASGISLLTALDFVRGATRNKRLAQSVEAIGTKIRSGSQFSEALAEEPDVFDRVICGMVKAAEASGQLETILKELAQSFAKQAEMRDRFIQAMAYPLFVAFFGVVTVCVLLVFVVPKLTAIFDLWDTPLPFVTRVLLGISRFLTHGGFLVLIGVAVGAILFLTSIGKEKRRRWIVSVLSRMPYLKRLLFLTDFVRLTRTWGMLLRSGVPLIEAIRSSEDVLLEPKLRMALAQVREKTTRGASLQETIREEAWVPELAKSFLSVGEETGTLDQSFEKIAAFFERELDRRLKLVSTFLEPLLILAIGLVVGFLVISLLLPIFEMSLAVR